MAETEVGACWWDREIFPVDDLVHLEGARLNGSEELFLPERIPASIRAKVRVCRDHALLFAELRKRVDVDRAAAGVRLNFDPEARQLVRDRLLRAVREIRRKEGDDGSL